MKTFILKSTNVPLFGYLSRCGDIYRHALTAAGGYTFYFPKVRITQHGRAKDGDVTQEFRWDVMSDKRSKLTGGGAPR